MILKIYRTGSEPDHWMPHPTNLGAGHSHAAVRLICEDPGTVPVRLVGRLHTRISPDGRKTSVHIQLTQSENTAPSNLCIPLPREAVSRILPTPGETGRFELRLQNVHVSVGTPVVRTDSIAARGAGQSMGLPDFETSALVNASTSFMHRRHIAC